MHIVGARRCRVTAYPVPRQCLWHRFGAENSEGFGLRLNDKGMQMKPQPSLKKSPAKAPSERFAKNIFRVTRRYFSADDKIWIEELLNFWTPSRIELMQDNPRTVL